MTSKTAFITGVTGQDGSYLSELLLKKGCNVIGMKRRSSTDTTARLKEAMTYPKFHLVEGEVTDANSITRLIHEYQPNEIYNLAAQSHVATSFAQPDFTYRVNFTGLLNILEAARTVAVEPRIYQASTSEMFGSSYSTEEVLADSVFGQKAAMTRKFQNEETIFEPQSPYAISKLAAHSLIRNYRESYGMHASSGILFNHESPRRGEEFVTRKITKWVAGFEKFRQGHPIIEYNNPDDVISRRGERTFHYPKLRLGNLDAKRDWGDARDYVEAMWLMLQQDTPDDFVIATGETRSIREFLSEAFSHIGVRNWERYIVIDPEFFRPAEVDYLLGDSTKAKQCLGWEPSIKFETLVQDMVSSDIQEAKAYCEHAIF